MNFAFSDEQRLLQRGVRELLEKECTPHHVRAAGATPSGRIPGMWRKLSEIGVTASTIPEDRGGLGLGAVDLCLILEEAGRAALPEPLIGTLAVAAPILAVSGDERRLQALATGEESASIAFGGHFAPYADSAAVLLLDDGDDVFVVPRESAVLIRQQALDPTYPVYTVGWSREDGVAVPGTGRIAFDRAAFGAAATLLGIAGRVIEMAAAYAKERHQFGRPVGAFQAVKHLLASAFVRVEFARPVVYRAGMSIDDDLPERSRDVSHAKAAASEAAVLACRAALQVHGAIGYTEEHDLHLWLRRGWTLAAAFGDASWHRERLAGLVLA